MGSRQAEYPRKVRLGRLLFRFFTGRPLDGVRRTDAIFIRRGRNSLDPSGWASPWSFLAGWQRLAARLLGLYVVTWGGLLLLAAILRKALGSWTPDWAWTLTPSRVLMVHVAWVLIVGAVPGTWWAVRYFGMSLRVPVLTVERQGVWVRVHLDGWVPVEVPGRRSWERKYVRPVAAAAQAVLGTSRHPKDARKWVQVPRTFRDVDGKPVVLSLPTGFTGDAGTQKRLVSAVGNRLGLRAPSVTWDLEGDQPRVLISAPPVPPDHVTFAEVRETLERLPELEIFLGLAARREVLTAHLKGDSPHVGVSAGPGAGKSEEIKGFIMQALRWGWGVVVLDWKAVSQKWCKGLPGVVYLTDIADIHDMCVRLGEEVDIRKGLYERDPSMPGKSRVLVVAEEMNVTAPLLTTYWANLRATAEPEDRRVMPLRSPAILGLQAANFGGRQFGMFLVFIAQKFSARVTNGNADLRESFKVRLLARADVPTFKMLAPQIKPVPPVTTKEGRWYAVIGQECVAFQGALITDEEARDFALGGQENPSSPFAGAHRLARPNQSDVDHELDIQLGDRPALPNQRAGVLEGEVLEEIARPDVRKLSEMVEGLSHLDITLNILQHGAKDADSGFPPAVGGTPNRGYKYDYRAVQEWARRRHAARAAEREGRS